MQRVYEQSLMVANRLLSPAISNLGDTRRLERFLHKLLTGKPAARPQHTPRASL